jgi:hypothetical protein
MLKKKKNQLPPHKKYRERIRPGMAGKFIDWALVGLSVAVVVLLGSTAIRFVNGESKSLPPQLTILRTQVANGCGVAGAAANFAEWVKKQNDEILKFDIYDISNFDNSAIPQTMVLIRDPLAAANAEQIAHRLGIAPENVIASELPDNFLAIDITIVLGKDYDRFKNHPALLQAEILNGCGIKGAAKKFSIMLTTMSDTEINFEISNEENFDNFDVRESMLFINSGEARKYSQKLADKLGIKKENIILDNPNRKASPADLTIVIGEDWGRKLSSN